MTNNSDNVNQIPLSTRTPDDRSYVLAAEMTEATSLRHVDAGVWQLYTVDDNKFLGQIANGVNEGAVKALNPVLSAKEN